ncbi:hypothetical protein SN15_06020 [Stenotrophomonas maltophilia]|nr:hypothetical protein SN15_06020 [Stenotrophomonas maltophilia]
MKIDTNLLGRAKELHAASILIAHKIYVYQPLVDNGFDLLASDESGFRFLPVQVRFKAKRTGFTIEEHELEKFRKAGAVLAFCSLSPTPRDGLTNDETIFWFVGIEEFILNARQRGDGKHVVTWSECPNHKDWLGTKGLETAFKAVLPIT